jgi:hypothetical protein
MVVAPTEIPLTNPDDEPTVATAVLLLLHIPPGVASDNAGPRAPIHIEVIPVMGAIANAITDKWQMNKMVISFFIVLILE